jgi:ribose transport system permease protein
MVVAVYTLSSVLAGLGGIFPLSYTETVFLNLADPYMLPSIAAVVIGGTTPRRRSSCHATSAGRPART